MYASWQQILNNANVGDEKQDDEPGAAAPAAGKPTLDPYVYHELMTNGFTVIPNVLTPAENNAAKDGIYTELESWPTGFSRHDPRTRASKCLPPGGKHGGMVSS